MTATLERLESALWQTTSLVLVEEGEAVLIDPGVSRAEVTAIADRVLDLDARVGAVLVTHADWDHVAGLAAFPGAVATTGPATAAALDSGGPAARLAERSAKLGLAVVGIPRCDRVVEPGCAVQVGPFVVETQALPGHTPDGLAYRIRSLGLLAVGDHLSPIEFPFVYHSTVAYRATLAALCDLLRDDPPRLVAPGHGRLLQAPEALAIAEDDLAYLQELKAAVAAGLSRGGAPADAVAAGAAVEPPRRAGEDDDEARRRNAWRQLAELRPA